jgi:hypothetical protein
MREGEMGKAPNPFSLYDFLGYFFPGAITVYSLVIAYTHIDKSYKAADAVKEILSLTHPENILPFVLAAYVAGHFLSYCSSITVEKYLYWQYGYPSKFILNLPYTPLFPSRMGLRVVDCFRLLVMLFLLPILLFDQIAGRLLGLSGFYAKAVDSLSREIIKRKTFAILRDKAGVKPTHEKHGPPTGVDYFQYLYHYALEHAPQHGPKMHNYVALYGFLRTLTLIALLYFWVAVWHVWYSALRWSTATVTLALLGGVVFVFFLAYFKFLRRYSLEVFMAAAVAYDEKASKAIEGTEQE